MGRRRTAVIQANGAFTRNWHFYASTPLKLNAFPILLQRRVAIEGMSLLLLFACDAIYT